MPDILPHKPSADSVAAAPSAAGLGGAEVFRHGPCLVCGSPYRIHLRDVGATRTRRVFPLHYCLHCGSFTCVNGYCESAAQLKNDVQYNVDRLAHKQEAFGVLSRFLSEKCQAHLKQSAAGLSYADVGCNLGILVKIASAVFREAAGYDLNGFAIEEGKKLFPGLDLKSIPFGSDGKKYDFITVIDVLEHIAAPREFFAEIVSHVNPKGLVYVTVPFVNEDLWKYLLDSIESQFHFVFENPFRDNDVHIIHYSTRGLVEMARACGLQAAEDFTGGVWPLSGILFRKP